MLSDSLACGGEWFNKGLCFWSISQDRFKKCDGANFYEFACCALLVEFRKGNVLYKDSEKM